MKTIVGIISSSIYCKVSRFQRQEVLLIGSSISRDDCMELLEACTDIIRKLKGEGEFEESVKFIFSDSDMTFKCYFPFSYIVKNHFC